MTWSCQYGKCDLGGAGPPPVLVSLQSMSERLAFCSNQHLSEYLAEQPKASARSRKGVLVDTYEFREGSRP